MPDQDPSEKFSDLRKRAEELTEKQLSSRKAHIR